MYTFPSWLRCREGSCREYPLRDLSGEFKLIFNIQFSQCQDEVHCGLLLYFPYYKSVSKGNKITRLEYLTEK